MKKSAGNSFALHCTKCKSILATSNEVSRLASSQYVKGIVGYMINDADASPSEQQNYSKNSTTIDLSSKKPANNENEFDIGCIFCHLKCSSCNEFVGRYYTLVPEDLKILKNKKVLLSKYVSSIPSTENNEIRETLMNVLKSEQKEYEKQQAICQKLTEMYKELSTLESDKERENIENMAKSVDSMMKMSRCALAKMKSHAKPSDI